MSRRDDNERFWSRVDKTDQCWRWKGAVNPDGYGWFYYRGKNRRAHRVAWMLTHGDIESSDQVLHACDNPACVRPDHLRLGTPADNMRDKVARARQTRGESVNTSKLTDQDVRDIRRFNAAGIPYAALADRYKVRFEMIARIVRREAWKHVS